LNASSNILVSKGFFPLMVFRALPKSDGFPCDTGRALARHHALGVDGLVSAWLE
jgi:hypothetical protein